MIDIHAHILPNIDDGSHNMEETLEMLRIAAQDGINTIVATPHVISDVFPTKKEDILLAVQEVNQRIEKENIPLKVLPGAEIRLEPDLPQRLKQGKLLTLNDTGRYLLVELPTSYIPDYTANVLYELQLQGIIPIIAHPERNAGFAKNPAVLMDLTLKGVLSQLTTGSITGLFGSEIKKAAHKLLLQGCVHVIASDAHSIKGHRIPELSPAFEQIKKQYRAETADILTRKNPARIITGEDIMKITPKRQTFLKNLMDIRKKS